MGSRIFNSKKINKNILIVCLLLVCFLAVTYFRISFQLISEDGGRYVLVNRLDPAAEPTAKESFHALTDGIRLISFTFYAVITAALTVMIISLLFRRKTRVLVTWVVIGGLYCIMFGLTALSYFTHNPAIGYFPAQHIKEVVQSPILMFILIISFSLFDTGNHEQNS